MNFTDYSNVPPMIKNVANGIIRAEGWLLPANSAEGTHASRSYRCHNPGNIFGSPFEASNDAGYSIFENDFVGYYALCRLLTQYALGNIAGITSDMSLNDALMKYNGLTAGDQHNNYMSDVETFSGVKRSVSIKHLLE